MRECAISKSTCAKLNSSPFLPNCFSCSLNGITILHLTDYNLHLLLYYLSLLLLLPGKIFTLPLLFARSFIMANSNSYKSRIIYERIMNSHVPITQLQQVSNHGLSCFIYSCPLSPPYHAPDDFKEKPRQHVIMCISLRMH